MTAFTVVARDRNLARIGDASNYTSLEVHPRFNAVGSWSVTYPASSAAARLFSNDGGVLIFRQGSTTPLLTGPVTGLSENLDGQSAEPVLTVSGACDNLWLTGRLAYPTPAAALSAQSNDYDVRVGDAETVLKAYVTANLGAAAIAGRQLPRFTVEANTNRGASVSYSARFDNILDLLAKVAVTGGLGFQVQQVGAGLVFSVYTPTDRSASIRFSAATGSLGSYQYQLAAPTGTTAIVGDAGAGTGRAFTAVTDTEAEADWGFRVEVFVDQANTTDATQLEQAGQQALDSGSPQAQVTFTPRDTPQARYGFDYGLGDTVTVQAAAAQVVDIVREVAVVDDATNGGGIAPTVGGSQAANPSTTPALYRQLRSALIAIGLLQRRR